MRPFRNAPDTRARARVHILMGPSLAADPLFANAPTGVLMLTREGVVADLNGEAVKTLATRKDRLVGRPVLVTVAPADRERVKGLFLRVLQGQTREWTSRFLRGDGVSRVQWVRAVPGADGVVMFVRDVTESRAGRPETYQLQTLLENLPGHFVVVLDGEGRIRYSSGLTRTHFLDDVATVGAPFADLVVDDEENLRLVESMRDAVKLGDPWAGTHWHVRVDGAAFPVRTFASPYLDPRTGAVIGALVAGRDTLAEFDARDRARRHHRLAGVGAVTAAVADTLVDELEGMESEINDLERQGVSAQAVRASVLRMRAYADSLSAFGDVAEPGDARADVLDTVREVLGEVAPWTRALGVTVVLEDDAELPQVSADKARLAQVVRILVDNALESLTGRDDPHLVVAFTTESDRVAIHVADTGFGVEADVTHRLFEPLFTTKEGRAGLGLSTAKALVQAWGGHVRFGQDDEERTVFTVTIPRERPGSVVSFRPEPLTLTRTRSVLIADDEPDVRASIRRFLEKVGFEVREAWSGRSALAQITVSTPPELILTDLKMDDGSGYWFLEELSRDFPELLRHTAIVTGQTHSDAVASVATRTGCPVIHKPIEMPHLLEVLDDLSRRG